MIMKDWDEIRKTCSEFDIERMVICAFEFLKNKHKDMDAPDTEDETAVRSHLTKSIDTGLWNSSWRDPKEISNEAHAILEMDFEDFVNHIQLTHYDARDTSPEALYNWKGFFHNGAELEAIHIAITRFGDDNLRTKWSNVLSEAFTKAGKTRGSRS